MTDLPSISAVVVAAHDEDVPPEVLVARLIEREDNMADMLRMAGVQFGVYPQIMAEVFASIGIGTPITAEQREFVRVQFVALMEQFQRAHDEGGEPPART